MLEIILKAFTRSVIMIGALLGFMSFFMLLNLLPVLIK